MSRYPDDFDDLREDGWTVYTAEDGGDLPHVLLLPPGVVDDPGYVPGPEALGKLPSVALFEVEDARAGVTVEAAVQSCLYGGVRHESFASEDRRAHMLAQRALAHLDADRIKVRWMSNGGGLTGTDNYAAYMRRHDTLLRKLRDDAASGRIEKFGEEWMERSVQMPVQAASATWTYNKIAKPMGMTHIRGMSESVSPEYGKTVSGYMELED